MQVDGDVLSAGTIEHEPWHLLAVDDGITPIAAFEGVITSSAIETVIAITTVDVIVDVVADECVGVGITNQLEGTATVQSGVPD